MGLNGDTVLDSGDVFVGWIPGESYGYKRRLRVTVDVRMEALTRRDTYETTDHRKVTRPLSFSICMSIWSGQSIVSCGQVAEALSEIDKLALGFTHEDITALAELHASAHLNDMRAACVHQDTTVPEHVSDHERTSWRLDNVPACPVTGYKYGHAWLLETLPEHVTTEYVRELLHLS